MPVAHPLPAGGSCPICGTDEERLSVDDALDTIRTLGRRYREAFVGVPAAALRARPDPQAWSMLDVAVHVRDVLARIGTALDAVLDVRRPQLDDLGPTARPEPGGLESAAVLDDLDRAAGALVGRAGATSTAAWDRPFEAGGVERPALALVQRAAHEGAHHLRDLQGIRRVVAPGDDDD